MQGLDPAGPIFTYPFIAEKSERLDSTDAKNVQCLHTDSYLGTAIDCGNSDYYANYGYYQPGCPRFSDVCNHSRANFLFESALKPENEFSGKNCRYDEYQATLICTQKTDRFGIYSKHSTGRFYFETKSCYPYV